MGIGEEERDRLLQILTTRSENLLTEAASPIGRTWLSIMPYNQLRRLSDCDSLLFLLIDSRYQLRQVIASGVVGLHNQDTTGSADDSRRRGIAPAHGLERGFRTIGVLVCYPKFQYISEQAAAGTPNPMTLQVGSVMTGNSIKVMRACINFWGRSQ